MADGSFSDNIQLGDDLTGEYSQQGNLGVAATDIVDVSNFTKLAESAKDAGDEWTKGANYFMALHAADSSDTTGGTTGGTTEGSGSTPQNQGSTIGLLLSTSVGLQKLNMKFNVVKGIIEAVAAKAVTIAQDIAGAARGR